MTTIGIGFMGAVISIVFIFAPIFISSELRLITKRTWGLRWDAGIYALLMVIAFGEGDIAKMIFVYPGAYITSLLIVVSITIHSGFERYENLDISI